ncbi:hypothetical protein, partial [Thiolapillus sp.]|uniref:hypothetical protein n=1 Tax=Thiolapillus sp. TaxID=2017437 RepID=UPI0025D1C63C
MTRTAGAPIGCQRPSRFWGLGCPKIYHEAEDTLGGYGNQAFQVIHRLADIDKAHLFGRIAGYHLVFLNLSQLT